MTLERDNRAVQAKATTLADLLREGRFEVPWHQRYYDWSKENVTELLEDLDEAISAGSECYFLDSIKLAGEKNGYLQVNDGQQRLVTFSLVCARLARSFNENGDGRREGYAMRLLFDLPETHRESLDDASRLTPRIAPPRNDRANYNLLIRGNKVGANGKLTTAWSVIVDYFDGKSVGQTNAFFDFITGKIEVVRIDISERLDPNSVFETLNARGKELSNLDLIRNYFYSFFNESADETRRDIVHGNLERARQQLREERGPTRSSDYMRCYLQCIFGFLPHDRLYRDMKTSVKREVQNASSRGDYVFSLVEDLTDQPKIELFEALSNPAETHDIFAAFRRDMPTMWGRKKRSLFTLVNELKHYKVTRTIAFALLNLYLETPVGQPRKDAAKLVYSRIHLLNSFVMRTAFVARKLEPSHYERAFADLASRIKSADAGSLNSIAFRDIIDELDDLAVLDDGAFIQNLHQTAMRDNSKARRFLLGIAYSQQSDLAVVNDRIYTVEHILPRSETHWGGWTGFADGAHEDNVYRIGNLTLLSAADNKGDSFNRDFDRKRTSFAESSVRITRDVANADVWSPDEIQARQERLANLAVDVWDLPSNVP